MIQNLLLFMGRSQNSLHHVAPAPHRTLSPIKGAVFARPLSSAAPRMDLMIRIPIVILMGFGSTFLLADTDRGVDLYNHGKCAQAQFELATAVEGIPDAAPWTGLESRLSFVAA